MQCPRCGVISPAGVVYCYSCGALLREAAPPVPQASGEPYIESSWAEYSGVQAPYEMPAGVGTVSPGASPAPGGSVSSSNYPYIPGSMPPGFAPPVTPTPKRRRPLLAVTIMLGVLVLLLVFGGIFVGIRIGQSHSSAAATQVAATATSTPTPDTHQLYQRVTGQAPAFVDSLQNAASSTWTVFEKPTYGCEIKKDGLSARFLLVLVRRTH